MTACPKQQIVRDKKFRASFKIYREHRCLITGAEFTEYSSETVDGAHIRLGCFSGGRKPSDDLILPLRHDLHMEFDRGQEKFIDSYLDEFLPWAAWLNVRFCDSSDNVEFVKACARAYYEEWKTNG